jgi:hypothetical protein
MLFWPAIAPVSLLARGRFACESEYFLITINFVQHKSELPDIISNGLMYSVNDAIREYFGASA